MIDNLQTALDQVNRGIGSPAIEAAAKALARRPLTDHGRATFDWLKDFSEGERAEYREQARTVLEAARNAGVA